MVEKILDCERRTISIFTMCTILPVSGLQVLIQKRGDPFIIEYLSQMFYHHHHAIMMSEEILQTTNNVDIIREANMIIEEQSEEMEMIKTLMNRWYGLEPSQRAKALVDSDSCLMNHINDPMDDKHFLTEMIQHHQIANNMNLLLLQRISDRGIGSQLRQLAKKMLNDQSDQIQRFIGILQQMNLQ